MAARRSPLVLAAAADVIRPMETATLGAVDKGANWKEMADFRNIKNDIDRFLMTQYIIKYVSQLNQPNGHITFCPSYYTLAFTLTLLAFTILHLYTANALLHFWYTFNSLYVTRSSISVSSQNIRNNSEFSEAYVTGLSRLNNGFQSNMLQNICTLPNQSPNYHRQDRGR